MEFTEVFEELREYARIIRNEKTTSANTALRIGDMYLSIIDAMEQVSKWNDLFSLRTDDNGSQYIHTPYALASDSTLSSLGVGSSEGGGVSYNRLDSWDIYTADKAGYVLSAALGWDLKTRLDNLDLGDFDLSGYLTKSEAQNTYATIASLDSFATKTWVSDNYINKDTSSIYIDKFENNAYKGGLLLGYTRVAGITPYESESWILDNATGNATFNGKLEVGAWSSYPIIALLSGNTPYAILSKSSSAFTGAANIFQGNTDTGLLRIGLSTANIVTYDSSGKQTAKISTSTGEASFKSLKVNDVAIGALAFKNSLAASDIPSLSWSKITSDKPTTLSGYGITDALPLRGGTINGWLDVDGDFTVTGFTNLLKRLTAEGGAEFVGRIGGLDSLGGNTVWEITSDGKAHLNGLHILPTDETYGGMISFGDERPGMPYIAEESDDALTIHAMNGLYISNGVYAVKGEDDDWSLYWSIVEGYANFKGLSIMSREDNEISYLGPTSSWIGTDLSVWGNLAVADSITIGDGGAKIWWDATNKVLRTNVSFASDKTVSSLGVGTESGGGGTGGYASLDNVASDVLPSASNTFTIGNSSRLWKAVYANSLYLGTTNVGESISSLQSGLSTANGNIGTLNTRVTNIEGGYAKKATTLSGYGITDALPLSGGTVYNAATDTPLEIRGNDEGAYIAFKSIAKYYGYIGVRNDNTPYFYMSGKNHALIHSDNFSNYALPLSGGTINSTTQVPLSLNSSHDGGTTRIAFTNKNTPWGYLGFNGLNSPCFISAEGGKYPLIHSGNIGSQSVNYATSAGNASSLGGVPYYNFSCYSSGGGKYLAFNLLSSELMPLGQGDGYIEYYDNGAWYNSKWGRVTAIDGFVGNLYGNADTATKLSTARTIWGQSFDGTGNVSGNILLDNNIIYGSGYKNALDLTNGGFNIGYGYRNDTAIQYWGKSHYFVTGEKYGCIINSSGNVTIGSSDLAGTSNKLYVNGVMTLAGDLTVKANQIKQAVSGCLGIAMYAGLSSTETRIDVIGADGNWAANAIELGATGDVTMYHNATVKGWLVSTETIYAYKGLDVSKTIRGIADNDDETWSITDQGAASFSDTLTVQGKTELQSGLDVIGLIQGLDSVGGDTTWKITSDGAATFGSTLKVTGTTTLEDKLTISKNGMSVTGAAYFGGGTSYYFGSTGNVSANTLTAAGATSLKSTLSVTGATTLSSTLGVTGVATFNSNIKAKGYIYFGANDDAYIYWDAGKKVLRTNVSFASDKTVSSLGVGSDSGGSGGSADWGAVPMDIIPISDDYYNIGSPSLRFSEGHFNNVYADAVEVGSCTIYSNGNASFGSLSIGGADAATQTWVNTRLASYISKEGGTVSGTLTAGTAIYTGEKTAAWDGKSGAAIMASGNLVLVGTNPHIYFGYGNATTSTSSLEAIDDGGFRIVYNMDVFTSTVNKKNHIQLNYNNTRIYRLNNDASGMQFQYGTSASGVATKGTFSTSGAYSSSSDITKKNILSYNAGFNVRNIAEAPIAYFTWKDLTDNRVNLGSIAQYWQLIAPECIYGTEGIDMTMDYSTLGLVSSIINARAIVSHENEIDKLKKRVEELESENKRLQERVDALVA